jgi:hypothetical protein
MNRNRVFTILLIAGGLLVGILIGLLVYKHHSALASWNLNNDQAHLWEITLKAVAGYLALTGALIAALKYIDERAEHNEAAQRESRKAFLEKRQDVYFRLGLSLARIMNHDPGDSDWEPAKEEFFTLYWGEIPLVADKAVSEAVEQFSDALYSTNNGEKNLSQLSTAITRACRTSLGESWNLKQPPIANSPFVSILVRQPSRSRESK